MDFKTFQYKRPDIESLKLTMNTLMDKLRDASSLDEFKRYFLQINAVREDFLTACDLAKTRYNMNNADSFYCEEVEYINNIMPFYEGAVSKLYKILIECDYKKDIEATWGKQLINIAELTVKTFKQDIIEDLKEENRLSNDYSKLMASAKINYNNSELTLSQIAAYTSSFDREVRKDSSKAKYSFFQKNSEELDYLYDSLVNTRDKIAKKLGYKDYVELGYARMLRGSYRPSDVKKFRDQIVEYIVPLSVKLKERQRKRLCLDSLKYYDESLIFANGNPKPLGGEAFIKTTALEIFKEMSKETGEFFKFMEVSNLMDLGSRKNKRVGGYCTYFYKYKAPFIFTNFNGTAADVKVLTHEAGHAFQAYLSRDTEVLEYISPTLEACEIHSMSMEYFVWPWVDRFFGSKGDRYKFEHLSGSINNLCYMACVDEFQHIVYENPQMSPKERKEAWRQLEKKYMPMRDYKDNSFLNEGGYWQQQRHIYIYPFYYIDYALAQICALQFWKLSKDDNVKAWEKYTKLCKIGGSLSFAELVKTVGLKSPFEEDCINTVIKDIEQWLDSIADNEL